MVFFYSAQPIFVRIVADRSCSAPTGVAPRCNDVTALPPPEQRSGPGACSALASPSPCVQTRSQASGKPLKKPGAYNTDLYYQEKDEGYGDVGVDQV